MDTCSSPPQPPLWNDDRISEVYKGEIWSEPRQERARRRISWLCSEVHGRRVLDVGCSQGIVSILLARAGFQVIGLDIQPSRVDYAKRDLEREPVAIQRRVEFLVGDGSALRFADATFDTVVLGEVIEHLVDPSTILKEVARVLKPGGRALITTPFGVSPHPDHKQSFFPRDLVELLSRYFRLTDLDIVERYFRIVALAVRDNHPDETEIARALRTLDGPVADAIREVQDELIALKLARRLARPLSRRILWRLRASLARVRPGPRNAHERASAS